MILYSCEHGAKVPHYFCDAINFTIYGCYHVPYELRCLTAQMVKNLPVMQERQV